MLILRIFTLIFAFLIGCLVIYSGFVEASILGHFIILTGIFIVVLVVGIGIFDFDWGK